MDTNRRHNRRDPRSPEPRPVRGRVAMGIAAFAVVVAAGLWASGNLRRADLDPRGVPPDARESNGSAAGAAVKTAESGSQPSRSTPQAPSETAIVPSQSRRAWVEIDNPSGDGWASEVISEQAGHVLARIGDLLIAAEPLDDADLRTIVAADLACGPLVPASRETVFEDPLLRVERGRDDAHPVASAPASIDAAAARLADALASVVDAFAESSNRRYKFKIFSIRPGDDLIEARAYVSFSGDRPDGRWEQNATWTIRFQPPAEAGQESPRIAAIELDQFEQATLDADRPAWFSDCTESVLGANPSYTEQILRGLNHWLGRMQVTRYFSSLGNPGLAVGDVNGDGLDDLYVCQESHLPNRLFLQRPDGTAVDVSREWGVDWLDNSRGALFVDLDNDADQDLVVAVLGGVVVASNEHESKFEVRAILPTDDDTMSLAAADYDNDGDIDLYVCVDYPNDFFANERSLSALGGASNRVYHDANNAGSNALFRNDLATGGPETAWTFTDVTREVGLDVNNRRFTLAAAWDDYDNDGDQDLYVANDFGRNNLYRNDPADDAAGGRKFTDVARETETEDSASGMSAAWGDFDRDGWMDLYVANMFSAAGGRITSQPNFKPEAPGAVKTRLRRFARGSTLMRNQQGGTFSDVSETAAVTVGRWAWGSNFADINNDGWLDLIVANGYITADESGDL